MVLFFSVVTLDATEVYPWGFLGLGVLARGSYMGCDSEKDLLTQRLRIERGGHEIEGQKEGEKLNFEVCLTRLLFIKVTTSLHMILFIA